MSHNSRPPDDLPGYDPSSDPPRPSDTPDTNSGIEAPSTSEGPSQPSTQAESSSSERNAANSSLPSAPDLDLFHLIDAVFGGQSGDLGASSNGENSARDSNSAGFGINVSGASADGQNPDATANVTGDTTAAASVDIPQAPGSETGEGPDNSGAIVITVNYMFMEGGDQANPGRTGSLVVTLPNNATNREPRIILLFISLATRMAYSALVTNAPKLHPGVTLDKFNSFAIKAASELSDRTCSICFEPYDTPLPDFPLETIASKKRKLGINSHSVSATSSTERLPDTANNGSNTPNTDSESGAVDSGASASASTTTGTGPESRPKYLCEHNEEYGHLPLQMPCGHVFGRSCLSHWLKENTSCPLCRVSVGEAPQRLQVTPISYIRFGGLNNSSDDLTTPTPALGGDAPGDTTSEAARDEAAPGLFDRAALVLFNPHLTQAGDGPPPPLIPNDSNRRSRNSAVSPVIQNILSYFGRARRQRESSSPGADSLFSSGVSSRRTPDGVETVTSDLFRPSESFHNFTSLTGHHGESNDEQTNDNASSTSGDNSNDTDRRSNEDS